ncbi:MAG: hypothetical protein ACP5TE_07265 [Verrucomicrobiia bacterium]|jgi:hypothetical protein
MESNSKEKLDKSFLWAVFVFSYDWASDLWQLFFHCLLNNITPDVPVYLLSNYRYYDDPRVKTIKVGRDKNWGGNMKIALKEVKEKYILYLCEDYFVTGKVDIEKITQIVNFVDSREGIFVRMCNWVEEGEKVGFMGLYEISPKTQWMAHLQPCLWHREKLREMAIPGHDPWQAESHLNRVAKQIGKGYYSISRETPPVLPYFEGVRGGFWKPVGVDYFKREGLPINLKVRPCPPQGEQWQKKFYRSILKRKMSFERIVNFVLDRINKERLRVKPLKAF